MDSVGEDSVDSEAWPDSAAWVDGEMVCCSDEIVIVVVVNLVTRLCVISFCVPVPISRHRIFAVKLVLVNTKHFYILPKLMDLLR